MIPFAERSTMISLTGTKARPLTKYIVIVRPNGDGTAGATETGSASLGNGWAVPCNGTPHPPRPSTATVNPDTAAKQTASRRCNGLKARVLIRRPEPRVGLNSGERLRLLLANSPPPK